MSAPEEWRPITGHPNYAVSNLGRVTSLARTVKAGPRGGFRHLPARIIKTPVSPNTGYPHVVLDRQTKNVHRLVALAFIGAPPFLQAQVNHINSNRADARVANLEWVTPSGNQVHSYATTERVSHAKGKFSGEHGTSIPVVSICLKTGKETHFAAAMDAVRLGFGSDGISRACSGKQTSHKGYAWRYADGHIGRART